MDVRGVLRRTRLPLVASLFLALLGGAAVTAAPVEPAPVSVTATVAAAEITPAPASEPPSFLLATAPAAGPAVALDAAVPLAATAPITLLAGQVSGFATGSRAPPTTA
ncbi:hypothetical protein [Actinoplanes sp. NPDC049681]|uniref:hypothetical protein n=1 Tax=Actinoplanes sp. NPDC049681 TaxID=3363905 RepID=UPI0037B52BFB